MRYRQRNPVLVFLLFCVMKEILCTCNFTVSMFLRLLNFRNQLVLYGSQDIEWMGWEWLICNLTLWILTSVILHEYSLVLNPEFLIQKYYISQPLKTRPENQRNIGSEFIQTYRGNKKIHHWKGLEKEEKINYFNGGYLIISGKVLDKSVILWVSYDLKRGNPLQNFEID